MGRIRTIYEVFIEYPKEEIDKVISLLTDDDKKLLYLRYGSNLENPDVSNWDNKYNSRFYQYLINKMDRLLEQKTKTRTIYQRFSDYTIDAINQALSNLNEREKKILDLMYESNPYNPSLILERKFYKKEFKFIILKLSLLLQNKVNSSLKEKIRKNKLEKLDLNTSRVSSHLINIILSILEELEKDEYKSLLEIYSLKEIVISLLIKRLEISYDYNLKDILEVFKIDSSELKRINKEVLPLLNFNYLKLR